MSVTVRAKANTRGQIVIREQQEAGGVRIERLRVGSGDWGDAIEIATEPEQLPDRVEREPSPPRALAEVITFGETCELLRMSGPTLRQAIRDGLPSKRIGREYRFLRSEIEGWLRAG